MCDEDQYEKQIYEQMRMDMEEEVMRELHDLRNMDKRQANTNNQYNFVMMDNDDDDDNDEWVDDDGNEEWVDE